jgi:anti-sigma-K factor RskA
MQRMSETTRRNVIIAGATGAAAVIGVAGTTAVAQAATRTPQGRSAQEPVVAHVEDHASDTVTLMVGEREVVVHDRDLVVRLLDAAGGN